MARNIIDLLGKDAYYLMKHQSKTSSRERVHTPCPDFIDKLFFQSNRSLQVLRSLIPTDDEGRVEILNAIQDVYLDQSIDLALT